MEVTVTFLRHVEVEDDVNLFNVDASAEDVSGDHDPLLETLELVVPLDSDCLLGWLTSLIAQDLCGYTPKETSLCGEFRPT